VTPKADDFLRISPRIRVLPIVHGSGDFAVRVREEMLARTPDCLAVPLPPSFQEQVEAAVSMLPRVRAVVQRDAEAPDDGEPGFSYVPVEPCQGVIAAIRMAMGERIPRAFVDLETPWFEAEEAVFPDPYALKKVSPAGFAAAILPAIPAPQREQQVARVRWMARRLRQLEERFADTLFVCSLLDWPWVRQAYRDRAAVEEPETYYSPIETFPVAPRTLAFFLGELPYLCGLYERGRAELTADDNLSVDGIKELVLEARDDLRLTHPRVAARLTPQLLAVYFRYVRNLCLIRRRLTPDLHTLVVAAQQTAGDDFALTLAESSRGYPFADLPGGRMLRMGMGEADVPGWGVGPMANRLPGQAFSWASLELRRRPERREQQDWVQRWNPFGQCSYPPEDERIESFTAHIRDQAKALIGADLARTEKFTTSVMDGIDIRETLRNWHTGDLYVKVIPPSRGTIEVVVFLFDSPADPRKYTFRSTWFAEHQNESTLAFFATNPLANLIGPGIAQAEYGGALFIYPPRPILDVWTDPALDFADTLEERLLAAGLMHSQQRHVAFVSPRPPGPSARRIAKRMGRKILHLPLGRFSGQLIERLRTFHVLNGKTIRSYAAEYIRET
jgi:hypothetical protein